MDIVELNQLCENSMIDHLGIEFYVDDDQHLAATMPVNQKNIQPFGYLHGGASITLAESLASAASLWFCDGKAKVFGIQVNANHLGSTKAGIVTASSKAIQTKSSFHIWDIEIRDESKHLLSICRISNKIIPEL